jgi:hypothetical protein
MSTWIDRFATMSPEEQVMAVAEDPSTLMALVNEAALTRANIRAWAIYCFQKHGHDAHLYNGLAELAGMAPLESA